MLNSGSREGDRKHIELIYNKDIQLKNKLSKKKVISERIVDSLEIDTPLESDEVSTVITPKVIHKPLLIMPDIKFNPLKLQQLSARYSKPIIKNNISLLQPDPKLELCKMSHGHKKRVSIYKEPA